MHATAPAGTLYGPTLTTPAAWKSLHPAWYFTTLGLLALMVVCMAAPLFDERLLNGVSVWTKPFKFSLSLAAYFATLMLFAPFMPHGYFSTVRGRLLTWIPITCTVVEMVYIVVMASLGQHSHFNTATQFYANMYTLMGFGALCLVTILLWMAWSIGRNNRLSDPMVLAIVAGLVLTFVLGGGFGAYLGNQGSHWVNAAATDADGILLFKWVRDGGDLRVAHFFGMHAMQAIPLFALGLQKVAGGRLAKHMSIALVLAFACAYTAFSTITFLQALRGEPFMA